MRYILAKGSLPGSNRTFMELKLGIPEEIIAEALVLIAPLWN